MKLSKAFTLGAALEHIFLPFLKAERAHKATVVELPH